MDGSLWTVNLDKSLDKSNPRLLIPSTYSDDTRRLGHFNFTYSVDIFSPEATGQSIDIHHLVRFNLALASCLDTGPKPETVVEIWHVDMSMSDGPRAIARLSSFKEGDLPVLKGCFLCANWILFNDAPGTLCGAIQLDWVKANGKGPDDGTVRTFFDGHRRQATVPFSYSIVDGS